MNTLEFFNTRLPAALTKNAADAKTVNAKYQFNVKGAGAWNVDLTSAGPTVTEGNGPADVTFDIAEADFQKLAKNPEKEAPMMFLFGKIKISGPQNLALRLQKVLNYVK